MRLPKFVASESYTPAHFSRVLMNEVWSNGYLWFLMSSSRARNTVDGGTKGETRIVGTRAPNRSNLNPVSLPFNPSGFCEPHGGGTWSYVPPCSSNVIISRV